VVVDVYALLAEAEARQALSDQARYAVTMPNGTQAYVVCTDQGLAMMADDLGPVVTEVMPWPLVLAGVFTLITRPRIPWDPPSPTPHETIRQIRMRTP
jgi:hypothetical protein